MRVGCPKEIKNHEYRVGLTPGSVREYVAHGHEVLVETGAGAGIGTDDNAYRAAGATIAKTAADVFAKSDMIVKVKEPQPQEWAQLREGQILYTYLHLAPDPEQTRGLVNSGVTAVAYETVTDDRGGLPLLAPMSEVAGRLSIQAGATALQKPNGGRGLQDRTTSELFHHTASRRSDLEIRSSAGKSRAMMTTCRWWSIIMTHEPPCKSSNKAAKCVACPAILA